MMCLIPSAHKARANGDSILSYDSFMNRVLSHHPVAMQARLQIQIGDAAVVQAKGNFDPKLDVSFAEKQFDDKDYYSRFQGLLKIPTWFGPDIVSGFDRNMGQFLNPENETPGSGLFYAGVVIPLGEGLLNDERRTALRSARLYREMNAQEQVLMLNDLYLEAAQSYWNWFTAWNSLEVYRLAISLAEERYNAVRQGARLGYRPSVDTLEAGIQLQIRQLGLQEAQLRCRNATASLSQFLWDRGIIPLEPDSLARPVSVNNITPNAPNAQWMMNADSLYSLHPLLLQSRLKLEQLEWERLWKAEQLKPDLNLKYTPLSEPVGNDPFTRLSTHAYTWGASFSMPLFMRKERGALKLAGYKIQEAELLLNQKSAELLFKYRKALNDWEVSNTQYLLFERTTGDYLALLEAERTIFNAGESSLFLVNARESGYIEAWLKLIDILAKNKMSAVQTAHALGSLSAE